jgi:hypothetical protein
MARCILAALLYSQQVANQFSFGHGARQETKSKGNCPPLSTFRRKLPPKEYEPDCSKRDEYDLCAQKRMLVAAQEQSLFNKIGMLFSFCTLVFTGWTAKAAVRAAKAAEDSAGTADKTLKSIEETSKLELRARISVFAGGVNQLIGEDHGMGHVALKNVGKLPARNVSLWVDMMLSDYREAKFDVPPDDEKVARVVQPGTEMSQGSKTLIHLLDLRTANRYAYVWGVAYYDDGYGRRRFTRFCHRYATRAHDRATDWGTEALQTLHHCCG